MKRYMLDTNMVSLIIKQHPTVLYHLLSVPKEQLCISAITLAEIEYGLAKKPHAHTLHRVMKEFLCRIDVMDFDAHVATHYGHFKAQMEQAGKNLASFDMMIASHADYLHLTLISNDQAFFKLPHFHVQDWTILS